MVISLSVDGCTVGLTAAERSALIWALEVARALVLRDDGIHTLLAEETVTPEALDDLADALFVAGCPGRVAS